MKSFSEIEIWTHQTQKVHFDRTKISQISLSWAVAVSQEENNFAELNLNSAGLAGCCFADCSAYSNYLMSAKNVSWLELRRGAC